MSSKHSILLICLPVLLFGFCEWQLEMAYFLSILIVAGLIIIRLFFKGRDRTVYTIYGYFLIIYGLLTLLSHSMIKDPFNDYFIHNDAAMSFYKWTMEEVVPLKWSELIEGTILNPAFFDYALAELLYGVVAKLAIDIGVVDIRLALRCLSFVMGALICVMIADILIKRGQSKKSVIKNTLVFGVFSYLFITSAIFSRDIFVCFIYTAIAYVYLIPKCSQRLLKLLLLCACAFGGRPENGALALVFVLAFYLSSNSSKIVKILSLATLIVVVIAFVTYTTFISESLMSIANYGEATESNTGGVFMAVYSLPFPINKIAMVIYMLIQPLPMQKYIVGEGNTWLTLPFVLSPYLVSSIIVGCFWYMKHFISKDILITYFMGAAFFCFCLITFVSPDLRRAFAPMPGLFASFCLIQNQIPAKTISVTKKIIWPSIFVISLFFQIYVMI